MPLVSDASLPFEVAFKRRTGSDAVDVGDRTIVEIPQPIYRGDTWQLVLDWQRTDIASSACQIRASSGLPLVITASVNIAEDNNSTTFTIVVPAATTEQITWSSALIDLQATLDNGQVYTIFSGTIEAWGNVTRV
jgi:hypothetical protein